VAIDLPYAGQYHYGERRQAPDNDEEEEIAIHLDRKRDVDLR
jgi:hypothetical protein